MSTFLGFSQSSLTSPEKIIEDFFVAFHQQDTTMLRSLAYKDIQIKYIGKTKEGVTKLNAGVFKEFLSDLKNIPEDVKFEERLGFYSVEQDNCLASVWMPYEFYLNKELSHCGVNNFQLISTKKGWKIFSIVDTRKKEACKH
ncbi:hypothetical protein [Mesonia phycicola]|nr:hypothetical protein [Mesonia phycicola]